MIWKKAIFKSKNRQNKVLQVSKLTRNEAYIRIRKIGGAHIHRKVGDTREIDVRTNFRKNHIWKRRLRSKSWPWWKTRLRMA